MGAALERFSHLLANHCYEIMNNGFNFVHFWRVCQKLKLYKIEITLELSNLDVQSQTLSPEPGTRDTKPETRNPKPAAVNPKPENHLRDPEP